MHHFRRHVSTTLAALLIGALLPGCGELPKGDTSSPEALFYAVIQARHAGDSDALWRLLHPDTRRAFERWVEADNKTQRIIRVEFPEKIQSDALKVLTVDKHPSGKALFSTMVPPESSALEGLAVWGAYVRSVEQSGGNATVRTWAGDGFRARKSGDQWFAILPEAIDTRLNASVEQAEKNLGDVRRLAERLKN